MNMTLTPVLPLADVWNQYAATAAYAAALPQATCWALGVAAYAADLAEDHAAVSAAMAKAAMFAANAAKAVSPEYRAYCVERADNELFAAWGVAGNPGPNNCGLRFFAV